MRLSCEVHVSNRTHPCGGRNRRKNSHSSLAIGFPPGSPKLPANLHVLLSTAQNKAGTKYKVKTNVDQVLEKFVDEGMLTVRFKEPPHDMLISKADPLQLKSFLKVLRLCLSGNACDKLCFPRLSTALTSHVQAPKTKVEIDSRRSYLELSSLPSTLTTLRLNNCELKKISERVSKLRRLKCLNLSDNEIGEIPLEMGTTSLEEVHLSNNKISAIKAGLFGTNFTRTLHTLDLSRNNLSSVPPEICNLVQLVTLKLSHNLLTSLPENMWLLKKLKHFSASNNRLHHLPGTLIMLKLENVDLSGNPFGVWESAGIHSTTLSADGVPSLVEWAFRRILKSRLVYGEEDLPFHLIRNLAKFKKCICGQLFVESSVRVFSMMHLSSISNTVFYSTDNHPNNLVPICTNLCSHSCIANIKRVHYAS